jgi:galactokinase
VAECSQAAAYFGVDSLRDVSPEIFISKKAGLPDVIRKRAEHVIMENERVHEAVQMLVEGNVSGFGRLMQASHVSLRDEYEVSCAELDLMVEISMARTGCFGARMTGAGFGGCAIALVEAEAAEEFCDAVGRAYAEETGIAPDVYVCRPSNGAEGA